MLFCWPQNFYSISSKIETGRNTLKYSRPRFLVELKLFSFPRRKNPVSSRIRTSRQSEGMKYVRTYKAKLFFIYIPKAWLVCSLLEEREY